MQTLQELYNKQERVIQLNNAIFDELERREDYNSSHYRIKGFIDGIMESMYSIQNEYILPYFEATGRDIFKWLVLKDDIILEYESIQDEIQDFYYQLA